MTDLQTIAAWHDECSPLCPTTAGKERHRAYAAIIRKAIEDAECGALVREHLASHAPSGITFVKHQLDGLDWTYAINGGHAFSIREANALHIAVASARKATS